MSKIYNCPNCGAPLAESASGCKDCGASFEGADSWKPHGTGSAPPEGAEQSAWRLVNLALGLAALLSFGGVFVPSLVPTRWLLVPWFSASSMETVSPLAIMVARIGINLWLPASVFIALFWLGGLHRKLGAPRAKWASTALGLAWIAHIAASVIQLMVGHGESSGAVMFVIGIYLGPVYIVLMLVALAAVGAEFAAMLDYSGSTPSHVPVALLSWAGIPPILSILPLLFAPSHPLALSARETDEFTTLCKDVGVKLMEKPAAPVRSIAYDWDPKRMTGRPWVDRIEMDSHGRVSAIGGFSRHNSAEAQKNIAFEFTESRPDHRSGRATINPSAPYYHFPESGSRLPYYGVETLSADVLAFFDVDKPDELRKALVAQSAVRYQITLTDRRSGAVLGVQAFVVDRINGRACGANIGNTISQIAFIYDAIHR